MNFAVTSAEDGPAVSEQVRCRREVEEWHGDSLDIENRAAASSQ
jgi:hypothetical protein